MKNMAFFNNLNKYLYSSKALTFIGFFILVIFFWYRFVKERLPKDLPLSLSMLGFILLILLCCTNIYMLYRIIYPPLSNSIQKTILPLLALLFYPLKELNNIVLTNFYTKKLVYFFVKKVILILNISFRYYRELYIYIFYFILPRIFFVLCLLLDCIYFKQLNTIYTCIIVISIPLFINYLMTCMNFFIEENITLLDKYFLIEITSTDLEDNDEEEDSSKYYYFQPSWLKYDNNTESFLGSLNYQYLTIPDFIEYQSSALYYNHRLYEYKILFHDERKDYICLSNDEPVLLNCSKQECENMIQLSLKMNIFLKTISLGKKYGINIKIMFILTSISLGCWFYILLVSFSTLNTLQLLNVLCGGLPILEEPFSGELLIDLYNFYESKL